jgi:hypothetical protein
VPENPTNIALSGQNGMLINGWAGREWKMADFIGELTNLFTLGDEITEHPDGSWVRDTTRVDFAGFRIELVQDPQFMRGSFSDYRGQTLITTTARIRDLPPEDFDRAIEAVRGMAGLLSFAAVSEVALCGWEYPYPGRSPFAQRWTVVSQAQWFQPLIEIRDGAAVRRFLQETCRGYFREASPRKLPVAIGYFVTSEARSLPLELQLATMFILFENLKSTYASATRYPYVDGYYKRPDGKRWSFKALLTEMFQKIGMSPDLKEIVDLRNEIIHSGVSQLRFDRQTEDLIIGWQTRRDLQRRGIVEVVEHDSE